MLFIDFNQDQSIQVTEFLKSCVNIPSWQKNILAKRPFSSKTALLAFAEQQAQTWLWTEVETALSQHPRIGEKPSNTQLSTLEQKHSNREQENISQDQITQAALLAGNLTYEEKFGFIFLIKAAGLSSEQVLEQLHSRLKNTPQVEQDIVKQQLILIALRRLDQGVHA